MRLTQRVAHRFILARNKPLYALINALVKAAGGVSALARAMDPEMMGSWDKDHFYQRGGAIGILDHVLQGPQPSGIIAQWLDHAWDKSRVGEWDLHRDSPKLTWDGYNTLEITWKADGGSWMPAPDESDSQWEHDYYEENEHDIDYSYNAGQISVEIDRFIRDLGAKSMTSESQEEDPNGYFYNEYLCQATWVITPEDVVRMSVGKLIIQAGESVRWIGGDEDSGPNVIGQGTILVVKSRRGIWPKDQFRRGTALEVLRGARSHQTLPLRVKGDKHVWYFNLTQDRKGLGLTDAQDKTRTLRVEVR